MENSKELGKKKIKEEDLSTVSGGCGGKKPKPKYRPGQKFKLTLGKWTGYHGREVVGKIIYSFENNIPKKHYDYYTECDLDGKGDITHFNFCFEQVPGCPCESNGYFFQLL